MNLLDVYNMLQKNEITPDVAATALGLTPKDLKFRLTRYGVRLPLVLATLDRIRHDTMTRDEAAQALSLGVREVNQLMQTWKVRRPLKPYIVQRSISKVKWEVRKKFAIEFIAGTCTLDDASENAGVSTRQMRRWVSDLLKAHFEMPFKDLHRLSLPRRARLADEIEEAEGLELAKQQVLNEIAHGKRTLAEEALVRIMARRARRKWLVRH